MNYHIRTLALVAIVRVYFMRDEHLKMLDTAEEHYRAGLTAEEALARMVVLDNNREAFEEMCNYLDRFKELERSITIGDKLALTQARVTAAGP